jgi:hypothetical protein
VRELVRMGGKGFRGLFTLGKAKLQVISGLGLEVKG